MTGYLLSQLSEFHTGLYFAGVKIVHVSRLLAEEHYAEHRQKVFFPSLLDYLMGRIHYPNEPRKRRVIALVYQGPKAICKIPPLMRAYATEVSDTHFYLKDNQLSTAYEVGATCLIAPGDVAWKADLQALRSLSRAKPTNGSPICGRSRKRTPVSRVLSRTPRLN